MSLYAGLFEAKSIQDYLFQSGRLRHVIGASELIDSLTRNLLDQALSTLDLEEGKDIEFSRRAGGAFYAFSTSRETLDSLLDLWALLIQQYAPALAYDLGYGKGETYLEAFDEAQKALGRDSGRQRPYLPVATPPVERCRRTGFAAVKKSRGDDPSQDTATAAKERFCSSKQAGFIERFSPDEAALSWEDWPRDLEGNSKDSFPFNGEDRTVALIHADGNGLGQLLINARKAVADHPERFTELFRKISEGIDECTCHATREATRRILLPARDKERPLPARPILLGGDDLTILVRADLAIPFLQVFTSAFETNSHDFMKKLAKKYKVNGLPNHLTIGAGIVYLHANQPFYLASNLAEGLMAAAKSKAKHINEENPPSAVTFQRITSSLVEDYDTLIERERTWQQGDKTYTDTLGSYLLGETERSPRLEVLLALQELLQRDTMANGPARQLMTLIGLSPDQARSRYQRWRQLMSDHNSAERDRFDKLMERLVASYKPESDLPYGKGDESDQFVTPLGDALALKSVNSRLNKPDTNEEAA